MEEDILSLKEQVDLLSKKVEVLEKKDNRRRANLYGKILIKVLLFLLFVYGVYRGYEYVVDEVPRIMEEKINELNPLKK